jgi:hypothetical protein
MAEEALVDSLVSDSECLIREMDKQHPGPSNVLWYYFSDAEAWRLLIAGPSIDSLLPKQEACAYELCAKAITAAKLGALTIADVKLTRTNDPLLVATKFVLKTPPNGIVRAHFRDSVFNGIFVKEMLILRAA